MLVHLHYLQEDTYRPELAAQTIYGIEDSVKAMETAIQLKQILDGNGLFVHLNLLPQQNEYIDSISQRAFYTPFPAELPEVYLEKITDKWYYSSETVKKVPALHKKVYPFGTDVIVNLLPGFGQNKFLGLAVWQYLSIALILLLAWLFHKIVTTLVRPFVKRILRKFLDEGDQSKLLLLKISRIVSIIIITYLVRLMLPIVQLPIQISKIAVTGLKIFLTFLFVLLALRVLDLIMTFFKQFAQQTNQKMDDQLIPIVHRTFWFLFVIGGIIQVLRLLDVNVTALIAGISIGGLALALAAQDTVKNLIGSLMIFIDKPFQIGDYIEWGGMAGSVEEVGFRTTRIKTSDTSIISVPNGTIANNAVNNKGMRTYRLFTGTLGLNYDTKSLALDHMIKGITGLFEKHPFIQPDTFYAHLTGLGDSAIVITYKAYIILNDFNSELRIKEELLLAFMKLAEELQIEFAFPSTSVYIEKDPGRPVALSSPEPINYEERVKTFLGNFTPKQV